MNETQPTNHRRRFRPILALALPLVALASALPSAARQKDTPPVSAESRSPKIAPGPQTVIQNSKSPAPMSGHSEGYIDAERCALAAGTETWMLSEQTGKKLHFSVDNYKARLLRLENGKNGQTEPHCISVSWPPGKTNSSGMPARVAQKIDAAWFKAITNTLERVPFDHMRLLKRVVIDNKPTQHGIAAHDRAKADDGRDGHTIWLNEHLFSVPNHWAVGNYGTYYSYHTNLDGQTIDGLPPDHELFSPLLLHELGHLVMYGLVNAHADGPLATSAPACAHTCTERGDCKRLTVGERESGCVTPYCKPFRFQTSTENWAEQYRLYYQSAHTRELLKQNGAGCYELLAQYETSKAPWQRGLPDVASFRRSRWKSCGYTACKPW